MTIEQWAKAHLISSVPQDIPVWHWTHSSPVQIQERLQMGGDFSDWSEGAAGKGLYFSSSAIDVIERGPEVMYAVIPVGTPILMLDADLFNIGVPEIMEIVLLGMNWSWKPTPFRGYLDPNLGRPAQMVVPQLLEELKLPCCAYVFGFHLAFMIRDANCLRFDPQIDVVQTVANYVKAHPREQPMLAPPNAVKRWLAERVKRKKSSTKR